MMRVSFLFILCRMCIDIRSEVVVDLDMLLVSFPQFLTADDMDFIISAQRTYCTETNHCHSVYGSITDVNMTFLKTRLKHQIDIEPTHCCEQCKCDDMCCCNRDVNSEDVVQLSCVNPQMKPWHRNPKSYPNSEQSYMMRTICADPVFNDSFIADMLTSGMTCYQTLDKNGIFAPPVFDNQNNITYLNRFCAECNNRSPENFISWDSGIECRFGTFRASKSDNLMAELLNNTDCNLIFYPSDKVVKSNCVPMIDHCNVSGKWAIYDSVIDRACTMYTARYAKLYKNMFCYICNKKKEDFSLHKCVPDQSNPIPGGITLRMLLNADIADTEVESPKEDNQQPKYCYGKTIYDPLQERCVTAKCMPPNIFLGGGCVNVAKKIGGIIFRIFLVLLPRTPMHNVISEVDGIEAHITSWLDIIDLLGNLGILSIHEKSQHESRYLVVHLDLYISENHENLVETAKIDRLISIHNTEINTGGPSSDIPTCAPNRYFVYFDHFDISYNSEFSNITLREENKNRTALKHVKESNWYTSKPKVSVVNLYPTSFCPLLMLNHSFYNISISNTGVVIGRFNVNLNISEYVMVQGDIVRGDSLQGDIVYESEENVFVCLDTFIRFVGNATFRNVGATANDVAIAITLSVLILSFLL